MLTRKEELKDRIESKQHQLQAKLAELKGESRGKAIEERDKIKAKLQELEQYLKSGWDNISESVSGKLNQWLKD